MKCITTSALNRYEFTPNHYEFTMERRHTFSSIADDQGVKKRTVQLWLQKAKEELGGEIGDASSGVRLFSDDEVLILLRYKSQIPSRPVAKPPQIQIVEAPQETSPSFAKPRQITLQAGDLAIYQPADLDLPNDFNLATAVKALDGATGQALANSEQVVDMVELLLDRTLQALEGKVSKQQDQLAQDRQQLNRLKAKKQVFDERTTLAREQARSVADQQTDTTEQIQERLQEVLNLGKSED